MLRINIFNSNINVLKLGTVAIHIKNSIANPLNGQWLYPLPYFFSNITTQQTAIKQLNLNSFISFQLCKIKRFIIANLYIINSLKFNLNILGIKFTV